MTKLSSKITHIVLGGIPWYHGSPTRRESFQDQIWDRTRGERALNENGPGMYFTSSKEEASHYGQFIYEGKPKAGFKLMPHTKPSAKILTSIFKEATDYERRLFLDNFGIEGNDPTKALREYLRQPTLHDAAVGLYGDLIRSPAEWVRIMVKVGFDGIIVDRDYGTQHLLVWNLEKIDLNLI